MALLALSLRWIGRGSSREPLAIVSVQSAMASSCVAAGLIAWGVHLGLYSVAAANCVALAAIWLALAVLSRSPPTFWWRKLLELYARHWQSPQGSIGRPGFASRRAPWLDPWTWEAVGIALAIVALVLVGLPVGWRRIAVARTGNAWAGTGRWLMISQRPAFDRVLTALLVSVAFLLAYYAAMPGIRQELSPRHRTPGTFESCTCLSRGLPVIRDVPPIDQFELAGIPHDHASGWGQWCLLGAIAALLFVGFWERPTMWHILGFYLVAAACCPLWASRWEGEVAVASALRWASAALLVAGSIPIWLRGSLRRIAALVATAGPTVVAQVERQSAGSRLCLGFGAANPDGCIYRRVGRTASRSRSVDDNTGADLGRRVRGGGRRRRSAAEHRNAGRFGSRGIEPVGWLRQISSLLLVLGTARFWR